MLSNAAKVGGADAVGVSVSLCGEALWVLYSDRSMARWRCLQDSSDCVLPSPVPGLRDVQPVLRAPAPQVVTCTDRGLQLWKESDNGLKMESRTEPGTSRTGELMSLAVSSWAVACGHRGGEIHLHALPSLVALDSIPVRHNGDVTALCFSSTPDTQGSGGPLLLASASRDRSAMVFRIDARRRTSSGGVLSSRATLLVTLPNHSAALQHIALMGSPDSADAHLAVCTADKLLVMRDLELSQTTATVRRSHKHLGRSAKWIGLCVHPTRPVFYAACGDRRLVELDSSGRWQQAIRIGGPEVELLAPMRLCNEGKLLAIGVSGTGAYASIEPGLLLVDVVGGMKPLVRLTGHAELASGFAFLGSDHILGCWPDGAMLGWDVGNQETVPPLLECPRRRAESLDCRRADGSPLLSPALNPSMSPAMQQRGGTPLRNRSPVRGQRVFHNRGCESAPPAPRHPHGLLEQLMASSPKPPKWAKSKSREPSLCDDGEDASMSGDTGQPKPYLLGKWARGSRVGAAVQSAADICPMDPNMSTSSLGHAGAQLSTHHAAMQGNSSRISLGGRSAASGSRALGANLVHSGALGFPAEGSAPSRSCPDLHHGGLGMMPLAEERSMSLERRVLQPLPPKPRFPPPEFEGPPQKPLVQVGVVPRSLDDLRWANNACHEDEYRRLLEVLPEEQHPVNRVETVLVELRARESEADLIAIARRILAAADAKSQNHDSENLPPFVCHAKADVPSTLPGSVEEFRATVSLLRSQTMHGPIHAGLGSEATEVGALLRRMDTLLRP